MKEPSIVAFDLGKVLLDFDYSIVAGKLAPRSRLTAAEMKRLLDHSPRLFRFETGLLTEKEFFDEVRDESGFSGDMEEFAAAFAAIFSEIKPMIQVQAALRSRKIPTYIFSNTNPVAVRYVRKTYPFFSHFDGYIFSYECGAMKPDARIYECLEEVAGKRGLEIGYLDDRPENVAAALARGWRAWVHQTPEETLATLRKWGLPVELNS